LRRLVPAGPPARRGAPALGRAAAGDEVNRGLAPVRQVKKLTILERALSIERGELTPTAKVRRKAGRENFAAEIDVMYE
jgi:long-subunit acyl-CoA synthetase (AMP-forming)